MDFRIFGTLVLIIASVFYVYSVPIEMPSEMGKWEAQGDIFVKCEYDDTVEPIDVLFPNGTEIEARISCVGKGIPQGLTTLPTLDIWDFVIDMNEIRLDSPPDLECSGTIELFNVMDEDWEPFCVHPDMDFNDNAANKFCVALGFDSGYKGNSTEFHDGPCEIPAKRKKRQDEYLDYAPVHCFD